jgi:hypothetical protein
VNRSAASEKMLATSAASIPARYGARRLFPANGAVCERRVR